MMNFRKIIALVLVIATLFSFATIASAAKSNFEIWDEEAIPEAETQYYDDEDEIDYLQAVRVLSYAGILNGYEDGTFQAKNNIRRNEMAKMIAVLANAGYDVEELYATAANFEDVPANDWAASYIAYCAKTGIVAGRSASIFDPNASVTGLETAKMLLVVLGFDAEHQGYVGADWKVNVLRDAKVMGLLEDFAKHYSVEAPITRDEAAHMMLNALKAPCVVGFLSDDVITVTNSLVFGDWDDDDMDYDMAKVGSYATLRDAMNDEDWALYGNVVISDDILAEVLFNLYSYTALDCFGRPGTAWTYAKGNGNRVLNVTELGMAPYEADFASYDTDRDEVDEFVYPYDKGEYEYVLTVNGKTEEFDDLEDLVDEIAFGKGVVVEIYITEDTIFFVVINTFIGKVTAVNMAKGTVTIGGDRDLVTVDNDWGFNGSDVDETVVLFWICAEGIHDVEEIEPTIATVTRADVDGKGNHSFRADGETYEYAETFGVFLGGEFFGGFPAFDDDGNREHKIYTDKYGFVMYTEWNINDNTEIVVIDGDSWVSKGRYETAEGSEYEENTADFVYFEEGAPVKTVETTADFNINQIGYATDDSDILAWVDYVDDDEMYFIGAGAGIGGLATVAKQSIWLQKGSVKVGASDSKDELRDYLVNNETQIIVRVPDYFGEDQDDFTYLYFDGINDIDANYAANEFQYFLNNECGMKGNGRYYAYIYVDATYAKETNRAFVLRSAGSTVEMLGNDRVMGGDKYEAIVNGEEAIVVYEDMAKEVAKRLSASTDLDGDGVKDDVPVMIKSDLVLVGYTLDDMPVWAEARTDDKPLTQVEKPDFMINGGVLSWNEGGDIIQWEGIRMDPDCSIWIATPDKKGEFQAELLTQEEFNDYREDYGWKTVKGYCWAVDALDETNRTDGLYDYLVLVAVPVE